MLAKVADQALLDSSIHRSSQSRLLRLSGAEGPCFEPLNLVGRLSCSAAWVRDRRRAETDAPYPEVQERPIGPFSPVSPEDSRGTLFLAPSQACVDRASRPFLHAQSVLAELKHAARLLGSRPTDASQTAVVAIPSS